MPYNFFKRFKNACKHDRQNIIIWKKAEDGGEDDFKLYGKTQILEFICNGGLENLQHINTKPFEKIPTFDVYAYKFRSMCILGYIAIMKNDDTGKWNLKSFKRSTDSSDTMEMAFRNAGLINDGRENNE